MSSIFVNIPSCNDYIVQDFLNQGGSGVVVSALRKSDDRTMALKLFGYTPSTTPTHEDIQHEIRTMYGLKGVQGCVQIEGTFLDTASGILPHKVVLEPFPVIVMELLAGGALFDMIEAQCTMSEFALSVIFKHIATALGTLHARGYVHRDLKLENLMLLSKGDGMLNTDNADAISVIKIVDFGLMRSAPGAPFAADNADTGAATTRREQGQAQVQKQKAELTVLVDSRLYGTPGYYAPETLLYKEYSAASDVWQLGCVLYSLLSGFSPFHPDHPDQITFYSFFEMEGEGWRGISEPAKDLVRRLLQKLPSKRPSISEVLAHPWVRGAATSWLDLDSEYLARMRRLKIHRHLKKAFLRENLVISNKERQESFNQLRRESSVKISAREDAKDEVSTQELEDEERKWLALKRMVLFTRERLCDDISCLDYPAFRALMLECELSLWASPEAFRLFDMDGTGVVNLKELLLSILALRASHFPVGPRAVEQGSRRESQGKDDDPAWLFFRVFDLTATGYIEIHELRVVVDCFLKTDQVAHLWSNHTTTDNTGTGGAGKSDWAAALFATIDTSGTGKVDFAEFKRFYNAILAHTQ